MAEPSTELPVVQGQEYRVKLGKSFTFPKENAFHTIKYDFKPLSVDHSKPGRLKVGEGDEVNVSLPVVQAESVDDAFQFRGPKKPCLKECVLIINTETGEAILEKISNTMQLKAIRDGRKPRDRSVSPSPYSTHMQPKAPPAKSQLTVPTSSSGKTATNNSQGRKKQTKSRAEVPKTGKRATPTQQVTGAKKGRNRNTSKPTSDTTTSSGQTTQVTTSLSMPVLGIEPESMVHEISPIHSSNPTPEPAPSKKLKTDMATTSSSSSSSPSSSSSSDSDSERETPLSQAGHMMGHLIQQSQSTIAQTATNVTYTTQSQIPQMPQVPQIPQAPQMHQILQMPQIGHVPQLQTMSQWSHMTQPAQVIHQQSSSSGSSSDSDSESSSGSSSSDSSDDSSDQENDKEVAAAFAQNPERKKSVTELRNDLQLSDSGSDSDV